MLNKVNKRIQAPRRNSGQVMLIAAVLFLVVSMTIVLGLTRPVLSQIKIERSTNKGLETYYLAESLNEDLVYRLKNGLQTSASELLTLNGNTAVATISNAGGLTTIESVGTVNNAVRNITTALINGNSASFNYGVQAGEGGFVLENNATVIGNIYSNGPVTGSGNSVTGDVVSAGPDGLINDIEVGGDGYANDIQDSDIDGDAYYQSISGTTIGGNLFPGSSDLATTSLPITDAMIKGFKDAAVAGGTITCSEGDEHIIDSNTSIGPNHIPCDLLIDGPNVTLFGHIWVEGNIVIKKNTTDITIDSSLGAQSVAIVADDPSNRSTGSTILLENEPTFLGSGTLGSYVLVLSQNNSAENGGSEVALHVKNNGGGDLLLYAGHGEVFVENNTEAKEITGYKVHAKNNAEITYESGLANTIFTGGPSGGYSINSWKEVE